MECKAASWRVLPLARNPTPLPDLTTATLVEWARATAGQSAGALAALILALLLLLGFSIWRGVLCCCACCGCSARRRPRKSTAAAAAARALLRGSGVRRLKAALALCALGVLGGAIYGLTRVRTALVAEAAVVVGAAEGFTRSLLTAGDSVVQELEGLSNTTLALSAQLKAAAAADPTAAAALQPALAGLAAARDGGAAASSALGGGLSAAGSTLLQLFQAAESTYLPLARTGETMLQAAVYGVLALLAALSLIAAAGAAASWPAMATPALALLLPLAALAWLLGAALTLLLRAGSDVCAALEPLLLGLVGDAPVARYYLLGADDGSGGVLALLSATFGGGSASDVWGTVSAANQTVAELQAALAPWPPLAAALAPAVESAEGRLGELSGALQGLEGAASFDAFHPVYLAARSLACCSLLDAAGGLWTGLVAAGSCALALLLLGLLWLGRMDRLAALAPRGRAACCHMFSVRDWSLEGQAGEGGASADGEAQPGQDGGGGGGGGGQVASTAAAAAKAKAAAAAARAGSDPSSPLAAAAAIRIKSWSSSGLASAPPSPPALRAASDSAAAAAGPPSLPSPRTAVTDSAAPAGQHGAPARAQSLPAARVVAGWEGPCVPGRWAPLGPTLEAPEEQDEQQGPAAGASGSAAYHGAPPALAQEESGACAPPLPAAKGEPSLEQLSDAARSAAALAFSVASRAQAILGGARAAPSSGGPQAAGGGQAGGGAGAERPGSAGPLTRQGSRPWLNY